jgi:hypothetical protein
LNFYAVLELHILKVFYFVFVFFRWSKSVYYHKVSTFVRCRLSFCEKYLNISSCSWWYWIVIVVMNINSSVLKITIRICLQWWQWIWKDRDS